MRWMPACSLPRHKEGVMATAHIRRNDRGYWDVLIGERVVLADESYPVACNVELALNGHESLCSECGEVADSIRRQE